MARAPTAKTATERWKRLLSHGFFAPELPPCFVSADLARMRRALWARIELVPGPRRGNIPGYRQLLTQPSRFNFPRFGRNDRRHGVPNPIAHLAISKVIADHFVRLRSTAHRNSGLSASPLVFDWTGSRAILRSSIDLREDFRMELASRREHYISADLRAFYHSIYTHSIPWAVHGKAFAKQNRSNDHYGNLLDLLCRNANDGQTLGLPVGPDTSRILAEVVASAVDAELKNDTGVTVRDASRYVDDYTIGSMEDRNGEAMIAAVRRAAGVFELELNHDKSAVIPTSTNLNIGWKQVALAHRPVAPYTLDAYKRFFYEIERLAGEATSINIEKWSLQNARVAFLSADRATWHYLQSHLINAYRRNSTLISLLVELIILRHRRHGDVDVESVRDFVEHRIPTLAMEDRSGELIWLLFMALALNIRITGGVLTPLFHVEDPMCALLISQAADRGLVRGPIDQAVWNQSLSGAGLESPMWPYAYEGPRLGIIPGATLDHIENHPYFSILHQRNIRFFSMDAGIEAIDSAMSRRRVDNLHAMRLRAAFAEFGDPPAIDDWDIGDEDEQFEEFDDEEIY